MRIIPEELQKITHKPALSRRRPGRGIEFIDTETGESFEITLPAEEFTCPCCGRNRFPINECLDPLGMASPTY